MHEIISASLERISNYVRISIWIKGRFKSSMEIRKTIIFYDFQSINNQWKSYVFPIENNNQTLLIILGKINVFLSVSGKHFSFVRKLSNYFYIKFTVSRFRNFKLWYKVRVKGGFYQKIYDFRQISKILCHIIVH